MKDSKNIIIGLLVFIIVILMVFIGLLVSGNMKINSFNDTINNSEVIDKSEDKFKKIMITLPSNNEINVSKEYLNIFDKTEKIIVENEECLLEDCFSKIISEYPEDSIVGKKISISNTSFDIDNDEINEILISFEEEYLLLHYYENKVYGYRLNGYRSNGNWRVNGTSRFSGSYIDSGIIKYTFNGSKLVFEIIAQSSRNESETDINYKVNGEEVSKEKFDSFVKEQNKVQEISFIEYSKN